MEQTMFSVCFVILLLLPSVLGVLYPINTERLSPVRIKSSQTRPSRQLD
jgi:hypothetical protein